MGSSGAYVELRASWLAELQVQGPLPERTVLVRNEATAHTWRRDLIALGRQDLLSGTRFVSPLTAAIAVLQRAGVDFTPGEEIARPARVDALLHGELVLRGFDLEVLRTRLGWNQALAATLDDLDAACIDDTLLNASRVAACGDLALLRARLIEQAGSSWTTSRILVEATARVRADASLWPFGDACLAELLGTESAALAGWLRAIPGILLRRVAPRPERQWHLERCQTILGAAPTELPRESIKSEKDLLAAYLFAPPEQLLEPTRPRSARIDGTVHIEEHAGVDEELDAAVMWVIGEVAEHATPLEQIAIVVPRLDPYASLLTERLRVLGDDAVHVIGGVAASGTSAGARISTALRALGAHLHATALADLLPSLRLTDETVDLSRRDALRLIDELGTMGGSTAEPRGALSWLANTHARLPALERKIAMLIADDEERERESLKRIVAQLRSLVPAIEALTNVARLLVDDRPLVELWPAFEGFVRAHVRTGQDGAQILAAVASSIAPLLSQPAMRGHAALDHVASTLRAVRLPLGRFGQPRVSIVSIHDARGLTFQATRVLGLAEGVLPSNPRQDAVLPDAVRATLGPALTGSDARVLAQLHALHHVVTATGARIAFSFARMDLDGRYREPSGVLLDVALAVGRGAAAMPDDQAMRQYWFEPAREALMKLTSRWPVRESTRLARAATERRVPASWLDEPLRAIDRVVLRASPPEPTPMDGWFPKGKFAELPGLSAEAPISASALGTFLSCPHRFLLERVLGWQAPPELRSDGGIDARTYGSLFHEVAETFYRQHGAQFGQHRRGLAKWKEIAAEVATTAFDEFLHRHPLAGADVADAQRARLQRDLRALLDLDWATPKTFVDVERAFGPLELDIANTSVFVRGFIDRLDVVDGATLVRDLKTGKAKPRGDDGEVPHYDVQLALYGLVAKKLARTWGLPKTVRAAYVYPSDLAGGERAFLDDFDALAELAEGWIAMAAAMLRAHTFPRTPVESDCHWCDFKPVCGDHGPQRSSSLLAGVRGALGKFRVLKEGE